MHPNVKAILWKIGACLAAAVMVSLIRHLSTTMHPFQIVFLRNIIAVLLFIPWLLHAGTSWHDISALKTTRWKFYWARAVGGIIAMTFWFYSLSVVPLATAVSLSFTVPLMVAGMATIFFGERFGIHKIGALAMGFIGVLIILRPGTENFNAGALFVIVSTIGWATSGILIKTLSRTDSPILIPFYAVVMMTPLSLPLALAAWEPITWEQWGWVFLIALTANIFQVALSHAISLADFAVILPFDFTRLIFVTILAYSIFGELPDSWTIFGAVCIMAGTVYSAWRDYTQHRRQTNETLEKTYY